MTKSTTIIDLAYISKYLLISFQEYTDLYNIDYSKASSEQLASIKKAINSVFNYIGATVDYSKVISSRFQLGDIILRNNPKNSYYVITDIQDDEVSTFPSIKDNSWLNNTTISYNIIRPNYSNVSLATIEQRIDKTLSKEAFDKLKSNEGTFVPDHIDMPDSAFQIGDVVISVDPQQISFTTQNGYQYYPTVRTGGNPIIPSPQQIKNITIGLIFPNTESINNQLLNIYAMFKRTPFVNIKNKDICDFFQDIKIDKSDYISVALESINIQSVEGFPNTLQATLTLLPFDPRIVSDGLLALRSLSDVKNQVSFLDPNAKLYKKALEKMSSSLYDENTTPTKSNDILPKLIRYTDDFRESLPFRAFYQALINEREYVQDEYGNIVPIKDYNGSKISEGFSLEGFRPTKDKNRLHVYSEKDNKKEISFTYKYLEDNFRKIAVDMSATRLTNEEKLAQKIKDTVSLMNSKNDMVNTIFTQTLSLKDYISEKEFEWNQFDNALIHYLVTNGIDVNKQYAINHNSSSDPKIGNHIFTLIRFFYEKGIHSVGTLISLKPNIEAIMDGTTVITDDTLNLLNQLYFQSNGEFPSISNGSTSGHIIGLPSLIENIWKWVEEDPIDRKERLAKFLQQWTDSLAEYLNTGILMTDVSSPTSDIQGKKIYRLPIKEKTIKIDFQKRIIQGWSLVFANKFVPMNIQSYKYPFYQHLGSENANMTLNIVTTDEDKDSTLGSELSLLSDRMLDSTRVLTMMCPDLLTWLDPRMSVDCGTNNIFKVFGMDKVVYNSSNVTNIQGQPNSWNIVLSLTQANISLSEYNSIQKEDNQNALIEGLATFVSRLKFNEPSIDGNDEIEVYDYFINEQPVTDFVNSVKCSFYFSKYIAAFNQNITTAEELYKADKKKLNEDKLKTINSYKGLGIVGKRNDDLSGKLKKLCSKNQNFRRALEVIFKKIDSLHSQQYNLLSRLISQEKDFFDTFPGKILMGSSSVVMAVSSFIPLLLAIEIIIAVPLIILGKKLYDKLIKIRNFAMNQAANMIEAFKSEIILNLSTSILKDPGVVNTLMDNNLLSKSFIDAFARKQSLTNSCYLDFDIPSVFTESNIDGTPIVLSPDFYLYSPKVVDKDLVDYTASSLDTILRVDKLSQMLTLCDYENNITKYDTLREKLKPYIEDKELTNIDSLVNYKSDITSTLQYIRTKYFNLALGDDATLDEASSKQISEMIANLSNDPLLKNNPKQLKAAQDYYTMVLNARGAAQPVDSDKFKISMIEAARIGTLIEILELYTSINDFLKTVTLTSPTKYDFKTNVLETITNPTSIKSEFDRLFQDSEGSKKDSRKALSDSLTNLRNNIRIILTKIQTTTNVIPDIDFKNGIAKSKKSDLYNMLPELQVLETMVYNKIGDYIRMNLFFKWKAENPGDKVDVTSFLGPEYAFLDYWNVQQKESNVKRVDLLNQLNNSIYNRNTGFLKMYPTFKIYFVEQNRGYQFEFNNYFSYNAVQSIEIIKRKESSSNTAVIRLSNIVGNLSDRFSFMREQIDALAAMFPDKENVKFLGTLNIKPGTKVIIKQGYASDEKKLKTVFIGKILEMNAGPNVEMICQSYGAQLHYEIPKTKFNIWSREKAFGEIVSALLDKVPELDNMGKMNIFDGSLDPFSGRNMRNYRSNFYERYMLSNLFGKVNASHFARDNPRDENIYLDYDLLLDALHKPTFDWIIYDQTVWQAIQEICLYNDNAISVVKLYNDDFASNKDTLRETLVVGNKTGYYKYTDSFGLSSLDYKKIDNVIKQFSSIKSKIMSAKVNSIINKLLYFPDVFATTIYEQDDSFTTRTLKSFRANSTRNYGYKLLSKYHDVYSFFQDEVNVRVMIKYLLDNIHFTSGIEFNDVMEFFTNNPELVSNGDNDTKLLNAICQFYSVDSIPDNELIDHEFIMHDVNDFKRFTYFSEILQYFQKSRLSFDLNKESLWDVSTVINNTDASLANNLQYKKIQNHYLISDTRDIISNNIVLNGSFHNAVNLYYFTEPKLKRSDLQMVQESDIEKLNIFPIKAFGDIRDGDLRPLNSFQKNIDTNWFDIRNKMNSFYNKYRRIYTTKNGEEIKKYLDDQTININDPNWQCFPSFVITAINLLKKEVSKMYQGTIDLIGNPDIEPYDILHISDYLNDMHGAVEVEEVIHRFTPETGFTTTVTPNLITYDRDPIQLQDVEVINDILNTADQRALTGRAYIGISSAASIGLSLLIENVVGVVAAIGIGGTALYSGTVGVMKKRQRFLYDQMAKILGRDCINFTTLIYHGLPYITGFEGVDYENLKTIIKHNVAGVQGPIKRIAAFYDNNAGFITGPEDFSFMSLVVPEFMKTLPDKNTLKAGILSR